MKKIGILFGMENSFPGALVEHINARNLDGIQAEFVETGAVHLDKESPYSVIVDRISHDIPFYRAYLKHAAINVTNCYTESPVAFTSGSSRNASRTSSSPTARRILLGRSARWPSR